MPTMTTRPTAASRPAFRATPTRALRVVAVALAGALALSGCGDSHDDKRPAPAPPSSARPAVTTRTTVAHVTGPLKPAARAAVTTRVGKVVDAWFSAAYVGGDYPRAASAFRDAFPGFTPAAAAQARRSLSLMTNAGIGTRIDGVEPVSKSVKLDILAAKGWPVGVTARIWLSYRTSGTLTSQQLVRGQLDLTRVGKDWQVFAFTVTRTPRPLAKGTPAPAATPGPASTPASPTGGASS